MLTLVFTAGNKRNATPPYVSWDLATRPPMPEGLTEASRLDEAGWQPKRFSYYLFIREA